MKQALMFIALAIAVTTVSMSAFSGGEEYVGSKACKTCHSKDKMGGEQYQVWEKSAHAKAFATLKSAEADKIAKEKGFSTKAAETAECLSCHVTGMNEKGAKFSKKFDKAEGVGCEACHGAAGAYKSKHSKNVEEGMKLGLVVTKVDGGAAEKHCVTCHNDKSPTFKSFDFKKMWAKIKHGKKS
jgi:hypothetical protein